MSHKPPTDEQCQILLKIGPEQLERMCTDVDGDCPTVTFLKRDCPLVNFPCYAATTGVWERYLQGYRQLGGGNSEQS